MSRPLRRSPAAWPWLLLALFCCVRALADESQPAAAAVVITATRHAMPLVDAPAAISVVSAEKIAERGADNVLEAIRGEPGVTMFGRTIGGRRTLSLRGMDARHTLFLVDGQRIGASDGVIGHTDFQFDWVSVEEIARIEVVRGPLSSLYGADALAGVVQIFTRPSADHFEGSATAEGSWADGGRGGNGHRAALRVSGPLDPQLRVTLVAGDTRRAPVASASDPRVSDLEGRHKSDVGLSASWLLAPGHQIDADLRQGHEERTSFAVEKSGRRRVYLSQSDIDRGHGSLGWLADWGGAAEWRSLLRAYGSHLAMHNARTNGVAGLRPNILDDTVAEGLLSGRAAEGQYLSSGFELRDERLGNEGLPGGQASAHHRSVFVNDEFEAASTLRLTAGLRYDAHERFGHVWSPRLYAVWRLAPEWTMKGGASRGFKPPTLKQITPGYREDEGPYTYFSDPALKAETNDAAEVGVGWDTAPAGAQMMMFVNHVRNLIVPQFIGTVAGRGQYVFSNVDSAHLNGLEAAAHARLSGGFGLEANYQFIDARDGQGQRLERRARHSAGVGLAWAGGPWRTSLRLEHSAGLLLATGVVGQPPQPVPDQTMIGANLAWALSPALEASLGVSNLKNLSLAALSPLYTYAEPPRTWRAGLRARW